MSEHPVEGPKSSRCVCSHAFGLPGAITLSEVAVGSRVQICCLVGEGPMVRRLAEMGFITGTNVEVVRKAPLSDPVEYQLRGYLVSLRREEANHIRVRFPENRQLPTDTADR